MSVFAQIQNVNFLSQWWVRDNHGDHLISASAKIVAIVVAYLVIGALVRKLAGRMLQLPMIGYIGDMREARMRALHTVVSSAVSFVLGFVATIMVLQTCGFDIVPLLTTASVAGLAIGFGAQKLVKDVISGFFILVEDQYGVGDYVTIGTASGVVEDLGMRTTRVRDNSGKLFIVSNGDIVHVFNHSRGILSIWTDVPVAVSADLEKARKVLNALGVAIIREMPDQIKTPFKCDGLAHIGSDKVTIRFGGGVVARYQDEIHLILNDRICDEFAKSGIELG